jgi:predicted transglutaminase-like cysteine proteinase
LSNVKILASNWVYKSDGKVDTWRILKPNEQGKYVGDCDDFVITALYLSTGTLSKFWLALILGSAKICYVTTIAGGGHAVLKYKGMYIDNWTKEWVTKDHMQQEVKHVFSMWMYPWTTVVIKMLLGKFQSA